MANMTLTQIVELLKNAKNTGCGFGSIGYVSEVKLNKFEKLTFKAYTDKNGKSGFKVDKKGRATDEVYPKGIRKEQQLSVLLGFGIKYEEWKRRRENDPTFVAQGLADSLEWYKEDGFDGTGLLLVKRNDAGDIVDIQLRTYMQTKKDGALAKKEVHYYDSNTDKELEYDAFKRFTSYYKEDADGNEIKEEIASVEVRNLSLKNIATARFFGEQI